MLVKSEFMNDKISEAAILKDLELAVNNKAEGQQGKARVLARRAVGKACQLLLERHNAWQPGMSALDSIAELRRSSFSNPAWKPLLSHFLLHVDKEYNLPGDIDLVDEAGYLITEITKMTLSRSNSDGES